ncbi:MAG: hypothetical protein IT442_12105 [Phycisphaeraceae bacterium]|nr:hypothetical protein [Phycisphaeraceae bacterium]
MALRSRAGTPGIMVALVLFGALFVITLVLSIVFVVQASGAKTRLAEVQRNLAQLASREDMDSPIVAALQAERGGTVVGKLLEQQSWAMGKITGQPDANYEVTVAALEKAGVQENESLLPLLAIAQERVQAAEAQAKSLQDQIILLAQSVEQHQAARQQAAATFEQGAQTIEGNYQQQVATFDQFRQQVGDQQVNLATMIDQVQRQSQASNLELRQRNDQLAAESAALRQRVQDLTPARSSEGQAIDPSLLPDGKIVTIDPRGHWVYIDIGRRQHVVIGMTFEVFENIASVDDAGLLRGKATLQVVNILEDSSQCLVVRTTSGKALREGDIIANLVYSPQAKFNFHVYGQFDINNTGEPSDEDRQRVERMITQWGGNIQNELTYDTDFLVLGKQPPAPIPLTDIIDPVIIAEETRKRQVYDRYAELVNRARSLSIPVLNQNRFLTLVGYFER